MRDEQHLVQWILSSIAGHYFKFRTKLTVLLVILILALIPVYPHGLMRSLEY